MIHLGDHSPRARHPGKQSQVGLRKHHYEQSWWRWWNSSWAISNPKRWCFESAALNMPANLENSAVVTGLEKVSFHSNPKERQCQRMLKLLHNCTHLQYSCLENPMEGGAWWASVHGVVKSQTQLSDFTFTFHFHSLEKEMATHSSVLAWRIPGTAEPGGLPSMGSHRVGHDWSDLAAHVSKVMFKILQVRL